MSEDLISEKVITYYVKLEAGRHIPEEAGFYAIFDHKEMVAGLDMLDESIEVSVKLLKDYLRRITEKDL